jgi:ubiquinone/menaquinone biosynthesis C-methylase UbiE
MTVPFAVTFVDPETLLRQLTIAPASVVADFGCGSGYFSLAFAKAVGKEGRVIALDILPSALDAVASRARMAGLSQVSTKRANLEKENGSGLEGQSVDWVILKDILFQNKNKEVILGEVSRILRPGGRVLLMEWKDEDASVGPEIQLRVSRDDLISLVQSTGFSLQQELQVGDFHYAFLLGK